MMQTTIYSTLPTLIAAAFIATSGFLFDAQLLAQSAIRAATSSDFDVAYVADREAHKRQVLDIYGFEGGGDRPVMILIHGGGWRFGHKDQVQQKPDAFRERDWVFVSIDYRMHPEVTYKEQGSDVASAIAWIRDHAADYGGSSGKLFLMGHSAGAHLAALVALDGRYLKGVGMSRGELAGVVLLDGAGYDVSRQIRDSAGPRGKQLYETVFGTDAQIQADASPIHHLGDGRDIAPFLIIHVAHRRDSRAQSEALADGLRQAGGSARVFSATDKNHLTLNRELGADGDVPTEEVFKFLHANSKPAGDG